MITFSGPLKLWTGADGRWHFVSVPLDFSGEIKAHALGNPRGFGSVKVEVSIDDVTWRTSIFPSKSSGDYFLPVKMDVIRRTEIAAGDEVTVELTLL
jgi:hypothetical protein